MGLRLEIAHLRALQGGGDEQNAVGAHVARLVHLIGVDHEVLAQHRQVAGGACGFQIGRRALEELDVGQYRKAGGAATLVRLGNSWRHEVLANHPLRRARLLDLGDHAGQSGVDLRAQRTDEVAGAQGAVVDRRLGVAPQACEVAGALRGGHFFGLHGQDLVENGRHIDVDSEVQ